MLSPYLDLNNEPTDIPDHSAKLGYVKSKNPSGKHFKFNFRIPKYVVSASACHDEEQNEEFGAEWPEEIEMCSPKKGTVIKLTRDTKGNTDIYTHITGKQNYTRSFISYLDEEGFQFVLSRISGRSYNDPRTECRLKHATVYIPNAYNYYSPEEGYYNFNFAWARKEKKLTEADIKRCWP